VHEIFKRRNMKNFMFYLKILAIWLLLTIGIFDIINAIFFYRPIDYLNGFVCVFAAAIILKESVYG